MDKNDKILTEKLEYINSLYQQNDCYSLGKYMSHIKKLLKEKKYYQVFKLVKHHLFKKKENKKNDSLNNIIDKNYCVKNDSKNKIVVYTCITGNYDEICEPIVTESNCDYYMFTNNKKLKSNIWKIKDIPTNISKLEDNNLINRYIKMHPFELFNKDKYDYSIYIDGNMIIVSEISSLIEKVNDKTGLAISRHTTGDIYIEAKNCIAYNKGKKKNLLKQVKSYKTEGFPNNYGMLECNLLILDLKNENAMDIFKGWWDDFMKRASKRDQLSLPFVLWKKRFKINDIGNLGNIHKNNKFIIVQHN